MRTLVMNSSHYVAGTGNTYRYNFPSAVTFGRGDKVAVANVAIFNSTFNITAALGNNTLSLSFPTINTEGFLVYTSNFTVTFPDGYYTVPQINDYLTQQIVANNCHMIASNNSPVPFVSIVKNSSSFGNLIIIQEIPPTNYRTQTLKYTLPANSPFATITENFHKGTPIITFNAAFGALIGFPASTLTRFNAPEGVFPLQPVVQGKVSYVHNNSLTPNLSPINSYIMTCSLLGNSIHTNPPDVIFTIPLSASLGNFIVINPSQYIFNEIAPNTYNSITIRFYDQNYNALALRDTQMVLMLVIQENGEVKQLRDRPVALKNIRNYI